MADLANRTADALAVVGPVNDAESLLVAFLAGYRESTRKAYARDLCHWASFLDAVGVTPLDAHRVHADAYVRQCEADGASPATVARRLSAVSGFYAYACDENLIARNPIGRVRRPRVSDESPRFGLDREEVGRFLAAAEAKPRDHALALLLAFNGLRISEALAADAEDLSWDRGHRTLRLTRKGGKIAVAPLAPRVAAAVDVLLAGRESGPLFVTRSGARLDRHAAWKCVVRLAAAAGIAKPISPHSLRHSFVTLALDAGVSLRHVQDAAGHADPRTTRRYDRARGSLDGHATYALSAFLAQ